MKMKMILAILEDLDSNQIMDALQNSGYPATLIDTTGGLLRRGNSTIIAGVQKHQVEDAINMIYEECSPCVNPFKKRATVMVFDVAHFEEIK